MANEISIVVSVKNAASEVFKQIGKDLGALVEKVEESSKGFEQIAKIGQSFTAMGKQVALTGGIITGALGYAVVQAANFNEQQEKFEATIGKSSKEAEKFAKVLVDSFGLSEIKAKSFLSTFGVFLSAQGVAGERVAVLSNEFIKLGSDIAAFSKVSNEQVFSSLQLALVGSTRSLRQLGISISDTELKNKALELGLVKSGQSMDFNARASTLLKLILEKLPGAVGAAQRNFGSLQDQLERLQGRFSQLVIGVGKSVVPVFEKLITTIEPAINKILRFVEENQSLVKNFTLLAIGVGVFLTALGTMNIAIGTIISSVGFLISAFTLWRGALIGLRIQMLLLPFETLRTSSALFAATINTVAIAALAGLVFSLQKTVDAFYEYRVAAIAAESAQAAFQSAAAATVPDIVKFNQETKNQAKTIEEVSKLAKEQKLILSQQSGKWENVNAKVVTQKAKIDILGAAYQKLQSAAASAMDSTKKKIEELDDTIKRSEFQKLDITEKYTKIRADIQRQELQEKGDNLGVWESKFKEATKQSSEAAKLIQKASQEMDEVVKAEMIRLAQSKIDDAASIATSLTQAVEKTDAAGNTVIAQKADESRRQVTGLLSTLEKASLSIVDLSKNAAVAEKATLETKMAELKKFIDSIPEKLDTKVHFEVDQTTYDNALKLIEKLSGDKTIKIQITRANEEAAAQTAPEGFATGGSLPGYGGGDRISAMLEAGEYVIRKEAVKKFGVGLFNALNGMNIPEKIKMRFGGMVNLPNFSLPNFAFATGGSVPSMKHFGSVDLNLGGRSFPVMGNTDVIEQLKQTLMKEKLMRSSQ